VVSLFSKSKYLWVGTAEEAILRSLDLDQSRVPALDSVDSEQAHEKRIDAVKASTYTDSVSNFLAVNNSLWLIPTLKESNCRMKEGVILDATIIDAPSSTKNKSGERDPQMHQSKKGNRWYFGMKAYVSVDARSGLVKTVIGTAANASDISQAGELLSGE